MQTDGVALAAQIPDVTPLTVRIMYTDLANHGKTHTHTITLRRRAILCADGSFYVETNGAALEALERIMARGFFIREEDTRRRVIAPSRILEVQWEED